VLLHPRLTALFEGLDDASVNWCLLRIPSEPGAPRGDVDVLIEPNHVGAVRHVLFSQGFIPVPGWTELPDMLWVDFDQLSGCFLVLEITDEIIFGPGGRLRTNERAGCLARRCQDGALWRLDGDDGFWALLLHCLLDKGFVPDHYKQRLQSMAAMARTDGPFGRILASLDANMPAHLRDAALLGTWSQLQAVAPALSRRWTAQLRDIQWLRPFLVRTSRLVRAPLLIRRRRGVSVALLGLNGAGKSTLVNRMAEAFPFPVTKIYMGLWKSGDVRSSESSVISPLMRPVHAWRSYLTGLWAQLLGHLVIFDRYVYDARLAPAPPLLRLKRAYMWVLARSVPPPDLVFLLDLPGLVATQRNDERTQAQNEAERLEYLALAARTPRIKVLDASLEPTAVCASALSFVWDCYRRRWQSTQAGAAKPQEAQEVSR
jgi:thymidylate kinase